MRAIRTILSNITAMSLYQRDYPKRSHTIRVPHRRPRRSREQIAFTPIQSIAQVRPRHLFHGDQKPNCRFTSHSASNQSFHASPGPRPLAS